MSIGLARTQGKGFVAKTHILSNRLLYVPILDAENFDSALFCCLVWTFGSCRMNTVESEPKEGVCVAGGVLPQTRLWAIESLGF